MKTIDINVFDPGSISDAIKAFEEYRAWLTEKTNALVHALGESGVQIASVNFAGAEYDGPNDVQVSISERGENAVAVVATGKATLFIEFGTGILFPDEHPEGGTLGMVHGSWSLGPEGKGHWDDPKGWYYAHGKKSWGNKANMPMYFTITELEDMFEAKAKEIFAS